MMSQATRPAGASGRQAEGRGYGLVLFASILMLIVGIFSLIYGIAAIANSHVFVANAHYVFGNLRTWGWITLAGCWRVAGCWPVTRRRDGSPWPCSGSAP